MRAWLLAALAAIPADAWAFGGAYVGGEGVTATNQFGHVVITRLGTMEHVSTHAVEHLYAADLAYLQELYQRVNATGSSRLQVDCPHCSGAFEVETAGLGG